MTFLKQTPASILLFNFLLKICYVSYLLSNFLVLCWEKDFFKTDRSSLQVSGKNGYIENYLFQY